MCSDSRTHTRLTGDVSQSSSRRFALCFLASAIVQALLIMLLPIHHYAPHETSQTALTVTLLPYSSPIVPAPSEYASAPLAKSETNHVARQLPEHENIRPKPKVDPTSSPPSPNEVAPPESVQPNPPTDTAPTISAESLIQRSYEFVASDNLSADDTEAISFFEKLLENRNKNLSSLDLGTGKIGPISQEEIAEFRSIFGSTHVRLPLGNGNYVCFEVKENAHFEPNQGAQWLFTRC